MNKNALILVSLGAVAFLSALGFIYLNKNETTQIANNQNEPVDEVAKLMDQQTEKTLRSGINQNEIVYKINQGEATYGANKQYFGKDAETIVGKTTLLEGTGYWNKDNNEVEVSATVDLSGLMTDNPKRDTDIQPLFVTKLATFRIEPTVVDIKMGEQFEKEMIGTMTLNGVSKAVTFKTKGIVSETNFSIEGETTIKMSEFDITAPNLAGIFTVGDELPISFKANGEALVEKTQN
jgi:polyisoprenoid-binding protein YceI